MTETPSAAFAYMTVEDVEHYHREHGAEFPISGDATARMWATCGSAARDTKQREEWRFHKGIPVEWPDVPKAG